MTSRASLRCLQAATALVFAYLCAGELLPLPVLKVARERVLQDWQRQQVISLGLLSCLAVLAGFVPRCGGGGGSPSPGVEDDPTLYTSRVLVAMNVVPVVVAAATTPWIVTSEYCMGRGEGCDGLTVLLDALGIVSAKLARLDMGVSFLLATRGKSAWAFGATGGSLGSAETISLHRTAGWWCARQSALHSAAYLIYYLHEGGARLLWLRCFPVSVPVPAPGGGNPGLNILGLINWFGVLACLPALFLALSALSWARRTHYHVFQRLHLPLALAFATCCALHDPQILLFAAPGLADWREVVHVSLMYWPDLKGAA